MSPGTIKALPRLGLKDRKSRKIWAIIGISGSSLFVPEMPGVALSSQGEEAGRAQVEVQTPKTSSEHRNFIAKFPGLSLQTAETKGMQQIHGMQPVKNTC